MQCYRELRVITARPTPAEEARVPHRLYGVRPAAAPGNAGWWREAALAAMAEARDAGPAADPVRRHRPLFLVAGATASPPSRRSRRPPAPRRAACSPSMGPAGLHAALAKVDQATAARLRPSDSQRVARAWEVWRGTGRGLAAWQAAAIRPAPWRFAALLLDPPREALRAAIAARFAAMLDAGALEEVRELLALGLDPALPAMRAHGVPELAAHLRGEITLAEAARRAVLATGQYTKRQATWFRHRQLAEPARTHTIHARYRGSDAIFGKRMARNFLVYSPVRVDAPQHGTLIGCRRHDRRSTHPRSLPKLATASGAEILLRALKDQGVEVIFGYPGGAGPADLRRAVQPERHPPHPGAPRAGRGACRRGLCPLAPARSACVLVTSGPGATNAVTGLADALMDSIPMVCLTGQVPTHLIGNDAFQEADTTGITRPATKHNYLVKRPERPRPRRARGVLRRPQRPARPGGDRPAQGHADRQGAVRRRRRDPAPLLPPADRARPGADRPRRRDAEGGQAADHLYRRRRDQCRPRAPPRR